MSAAIRALKLAAVPPIAPLPAWPVKASDLVSPTPRSKAVLVGSKMNI